MNSFSMLQTINEAYKVACLKGSYLPAMRMFYLASLGAVRSMQLEGTLGNFKAGTEADFVVLDKKSMPLLGDDRTVAVTDSGDNCVHAWGAG